MSAVMQSSALSREWPRSLVRCFKTFRIADACLERMFRGLSPKLRAAVVRVFRAMDDAFVENREAPNPPQWVERKTWTNSLRCGVMSVRFDNGAALMLGVNANSFWTGQLAHCLSLCLRVSFALCPRAVLACL